MERVFKLRKRWYGRNKPLFHINYVYLKPT